MSAPSWDQLTEASCTGQALGYQLGWQKGWTAGYEAAQEDAQDARRAALVARAGVEGIEAVRARESAAQRPGVPPAARWSA